MKGEKYCGGNHRRGCRGKTEYVGEDLPKVDKELLFPVLEWVCDMDGVV